MPTISLATYALEIRKRHARAKEPGEIISSFDGADLLDIMKEFLAGARSPLHDKTNKTLFTVKQNSSSDRTYTGIIETGEYGYASRLVDVTNNKTAYSRKPGEAQMLPFFFHLYIPKDETIGLLILQRFQNLGIRKMFDQAFTEFFRRSHPNYIVTIDPIVHPKLLEEYSKAGVVRRVTFRRFTLPNDLTDTYSGELNSKNAYVEYSIVAKRNSNLPVFSRLLRKLTDPTDKTPLVIKTPPSFPTERTLLEVSLGGRVRTVDITDLGKIRAYYDITSEVKMGDDGHPLPKMLAAACEKVASEIWTAIKGV